MAPTAPHAAKPTATARISQGAGAVGVLSKWRRRRAPRMNTARATKQGSP